MTNLETIVSQFALIGTMTSEGAALFAIDNGIDADAEATTDSIRAISGAVDAFIDKYAMRSSSVSENGISFSWTDVQNKNHLLLRLRKYGVTVNGETASELGISVIKDVTNKW